MFLILVEWLEHRRVGELQPGKGEIKTQKRIVIGLQWKYYVVLQLQYVESWDWTEFAHSAGASQWSLPHYEVTPKQIQTTLSNGRKLKKE